MQAKYNSKVRYLGVWFLSITWKVTRTPEGQQVLTSTVKALECREREWYAIHNEWVFCFATFANSYMYKLIVPEAHFYADMIGASPTVIACKMAKLFKFLYSPTQCGPTIVKGNWKCLGYMYMVGRI